MDAVVSEWETFPSYSDLFSGIRDFLEKSYRETHYKEKEIHHAESSWEYYTNFSTNDLFLLILLSIVWTILRHLATEKIFKPLAHHCALTPTNKEKMPESSWKFICYFCSWIYILYVLVLSGNYKFFQKPSTVWDNWSVSESLPLDIYIIYMGQCSFYIHSIYACLILDTWRKDSAVMTIHHVLTVALICISYTLRYHNIGVLLLFTHDICDIFLEFAKLNVYFKIQKDEYVRIHELFANISFGCFVVAWCVCRLYWYPLKVLYAASAEVVRRNLVLPNIVFMNGLLWLLLLLNLYWFLFILQTLYRVVTGQGQKDVRDYDAGQKLHYTKNHSIENGVLNGNSICADDVITNGEGAMSRRAKSD